MNNAALELLEHALKLVENDRNDEFQIGLCFYLEKAENNIINRAWVRIAHNQIIELMREWPGFSGKAHYPVPGYDDYDPQQAYILKKHLWNDNHPYGQKRWEMVTWIKQQLEIEK